MASSSMFISFVVMIMMGYFIEPSDAFKYYVGGKDGWSLKPSKTFNNWASSNRFQVHDSLIFKYEKGTDSVLQVDQEDYITCNKKNPILALENKGDYSTFNLDHSGFFFFISGHDDNCQKGEKVIILVMAPRNYTLTSPTSAPSQSQGVVSPAPSIVHGISPVSSHAPSPIEGISPVSSQASSPFHVISPVSSQAPSPFQGISPVSNQVPSPFHGISPVSSQAPSPFHVISPVSGQAPSPFQGISPVSSQAPSPFHGIPHVQPPAHAPIRQHSPFQKITPISSPAPSHVLPPAQSPHVHKITPISSPAPAPARVGKTTHHHHTHSPAPSPIRGASHVRPPAPSPVQKSTPTSTPAPSPMVNENPPATAPGPSDQAPSPDDGKSAAAPKSFKGDLLMAVLLFWILFNF